MKIGNRTYENYTYVMAIINLTPDSFYADSRADRDSALFRAEKAVRDGAAILDLGAQSTRPGHTAVSAEEELARLGEIVRDIKARIDAPVSVDTYHSSCAEQALLQGADMINDVSGLMHDENMAGIVARHGAAVCIMHNSPSPLVGDVFPPVIDFLRRSAQRAVAAGIRRDAICVDGGIGFAKDRQQNFALLNSYERLAETGYPLLLGASRKSLFGGKAEDRLPATIASTRLAARKGILFVRVHDVRENVEAIREEYGR